MSPWAFCFFWLRLWLNIFNFAEWLYRRPDEPGATYYGYSYRDGQRIRESLGIAILSEANCQPERRMLATRRQGTGGKRIQLVGFEVLRMRGDGELGNMDALY